MNRLRIPKTRLFHLIFVFVCLFMLARPATIATAEPEGDHPGARVLETRFLYGATGKSDERDIDSSPVIAIDPVTKRMLAVWVSAQNASSSSSGLDIYGMLIDSFGKPLGSVFRISDTNSVARNSSPSVVAGNGEFVVAWGVRGSTCRIALQRVTGPNGLTDQILVSGSTHHHSPALAYNRKTGRYLVAFVNGNDYLPPSFFGAKTSDCGDQSNSTSKVQVKEFHFDNNGQVIEGNLVDASSVALGAFRPAIAFSPQLDQVLVAWEDRREAASQPGRFSVFIQRFDGLLTPIGENTSLAPPADYYSGSTPWTPRPSLAAGSDRFLAAWFSREVADGTDTWSATGRVISGTAFLTDPFKIVELYYGENHDTQPPSGFLDTAYSSSISEFVVGLSIYIESIRGYFSVANVQRVNSAGQLVALNGSIQKEPGIGSLLDMRRENQFSISLESVPRSAGLATYRALYSRRSTTSSNPMDFDIWLGGLWVGVGADQSTYFPNLYRR